MPERSDLRNVAIIAHVDHGKTTLVDAMLRQSDVFAVHEELTDRVMDSMDQERERGITILAKNAAVRYVPPGGDEVKLNLVDTPGHADFGGEVERGLTMVDGVLLLVDASEGPLPQTRFVLRKALEARLPVVLCVNKVDRPDARPARWWTRSTSCSSTWTPTSPRSSSRSSTRTRSRAGRARPRARPAATSGRCSTCCWAACRRPTYEDGHPLQARVTNLDADSYVGRLALCRVHQGTIEKGQQVAWCRRDGSTETVKVAELYVTEGLQRTPADRAGPGEVIALAGIPEITIGETIADAEDPRPLPLIAVEEPALAMTVGINTSPLAGQSGSRLTARQVRDRLGQELVGNVSIRLLESERPDTWEVQGRGELQLAVLVETMRREGFELTVGKPQVVTKEVDGKVHEPIERLSIDVPEDFLGVVTQMLALRKGRMETMVNHGTGWVRIDFRVPTRGLIGFRSEFLTETRGTGIMHSVFEGYEPWQGDIRTRPTGSLVADRRGETGSFALLKLQERGQLFVGPGEEVYEGMVMGENARAEDLDVNAVREKKQTNVRAAGSDETIKLVPPHRLSLDQALEFIRADECVEVTPDAVRLRKLVIDAGERQKLARARKHA